MSSGQHAGLQGLRHGQARWSQLHLSLPRLDGVGLAVALLYVGLFALSLFQFTDPDYGWHVTTGRLIVENGSIPTHDPFTFTSGDRAWVTHEWLAEVVMYVVQSLGGYGANVLLFSSMALAALAFAHRTALSLGVSRWLAIGLVALSGAMSLPYWTVRPQVFTWLLFAVFLSILVAYRRSGGRQIWVLPPLMLLWANLHLGHAIGLGLVALFVVATAAEAKLLRVQRDLRTPLVVFGACVGVSFLNPNSIHQFLYPLQYLRPGNPNVALITEWQSPDFHEPGHMLLAAAILCLIAVGVFSARKELFLPALAIAFTYFALQSIRHQPLFALVFVVAMAARLAGSEWWSKLDARTAPETVHSGINWTLLGAGLVAAAIFVSSAPGVQLEQTPRLDGSPSYPEAGAAYIRTNYPEARVFNTLIWGGYLTSELYPQRVFVDGRSDLHGGDLYRDYLDVVDLTPGWQSVLDDYAIDLVIIPSGSSLAGALDASDEWALAFEGPRESVFVRGASATP